MERNTLFALFGAMGVVLVLGAASYLNMTAQDSNILSNCNDGTLNMQCSANRPSMCVNGVLVQNTSVCGCPSGYIEDGNSCKLIEKCNDGTPLNQCSVSRPLYCDGGELVQKASMCGCAGGYIVNENVCVLQNDTVSLTRVFAYTLNMQDSV